MFDSLRRGLGAWAARGWVSHVVAMLVYGRLGQAEHRMKRLMALFKAGTVWRRMPRMAAVAVERAKMTEPAPVPRALPVDFAWLVKQAKWEAAALASQLQTVLERPEMVALLLACPQARRVMGPICRMLAIAPGVLRPRPDGEPETVAEAAPKVKRVRKPRPPIDWGQIPLPRGVLTAARRAGFKPVR